MIKHIISQIRFQNLTSQRDRLLGMLYKTDGILLPTDTPTKFRVRRQGSKKWETLVQPNTPMNVAVWLAHDRQLKSQPFDIIHNLND